MTVGDFLPVEVLGCNFYFQIRQSDGFSMIFHGSMVVPIYPIGSMGLVYLPTFMVDFYGKCR